MHIMDLAHNYKPVENGHPELSGHAPEGNHIDFTDRYMRYNGKPFFSICGEFHFSRYPAGKWIKEILKIKACGLDTVSTYMFWNYHEPLPGQFDFSENNDIRKFVQLCFKHGMRVILRIGPYAHGECRNGGIPDWLFGRPFDVRSNAEEYLDSVEKYFNEIGKQVADLMFTRGGPIIGIQLENEYTVATSPWEQTVTHALEWLPSGDGGLEHMLNLKRLAQNAGLVSCFYTATGWGSAPYEVGTMLPLWGGYAYWPWLYWEKPYDNDHPMTSGYLFRDAHAEAIRDGLDPKYPYACCEIGGGMQVWYPYRFICEPESVEAMSLVTVANGCNFLGYYMFHGGLNRNINGTYMNEKLCPLVSYDFQAPLGDCGQPKESYKRLKLLHYMYKDMQAGLCEMQTFIPESNRGLCESNVEELRWAVRTDGKSGILFVNNYQDHARTADHHDVSFKLTYCDGQVLFPMSGGITIRSGSCYAFVFNMDMGGAVLKYASAQYITRVRTDEEIIFFFFAHEGIDPQFCIDEMLLRPDQNGNILTDRKSTEGRDIRIICLSREESLDFYHLNIAGQDHAVISKVSVYSDDKDLFFEMLDTEEASVRVIPPPEGCDEIFSVKADMPSVVSEISYTHPDRAVVKFDVSVLDDLSELYVYIDYIGDIGRAFIGGEIIHDDFSNGTTWKIALKEHRMKLTGHDLYIYISPDSVPGSSSQAEIKGIRLVPEKTISRRIR